jgi:PKD repeat protein
MRKFLPLFLILCFLNTKAEAQCSPAFTYVVNFATAQFQATNTAPQLLHRWFFGDGNQGFGTNATHTYQTPGTYTVKHLVIDSASTCRDSSTQTIVVNFVSCNASFTTIQDTANLNTFHFTATSTGPTLFHSWLFGDGGQATGAVVTHTYNSPGTYTVWHTIHDTVSNCIDTVAQMINVSPATNCNAAFTALRDSIQQNLFYFSAANNTPGVLHTWHFGDGGQGTGANTSHLYSSPGTYFVIHIIHDTANNCTDSAQQSVVINPTVNCNASYTATRDSVQHTRYYFNALSTGPGHSYQWKIDNVQVSTSASFTRVLTPGFHQVCLLVTTTSGCSALNCQDLFVVDSTACNWQASFTTTAAPSNPKQITFYPNPTGATKSYVWTIYQPMQAPVIYTTVNPVHTYSTAGTYPVRLDIYDSATACFDTVRQNVQVHGSPADSCNVSFTYTVQQNQVSFTGVSNQTFTSQTWYIVAFDSSLNVTLNTMNPTYTFADSGSYSVCLYAVTNTGCARWYCQTISVAGARVMNVLPSFPNPADGPNVNLRLTLPETNRIRVTVYNTSGNIVYDAERSGSQGSNTITIPVAGLQRGQYFVDIRYGNERKRSIFQKL